jgi:hypothetical protein
MIIPFLWFSASTFKSPLHRSLFFASLFVFGVVERFTPYINASPLLALSLASVNGTWRCGGINATENTPLLPGGRMLSPEKELGSIVTGRKKSW